MTDYTGTVELRKIVQADLEVFFRAQQDSESNELAKVYPRDRSDFDAHWAKILSDPKVIGRTIIYDRQAVGNINSFLIEGDTFVGYWIEREFWGKGIATRALEQFLVVDLKRPMHAIVATGNIGSCRVLERCGFIRLREVDSPGTDRFAPCVEAYYRLDSTKTALNDSNR